MTEGGKLSKSKHKITVREKPTALIPILKNVNRHAHLYPGFQCYLCIHDFGGRLHGTLKTSRFLKNTRF